jgi:hypothetical protein
MLLSGERRRRFKSSHTDHSLAHHKYFVYLSIGNLVSRELKSKKVWKVRLRKQFSESECAGFGRTVSLSFRRKWHPKIDSQPNRSEKSARVTKT